MPWPAIAELAESVRTGKVSAMSLVEQSLKAAGDHQEYNALLRINEQAKERAQQIDEMIKEGKNPGELAGVPFIAKDNFLTKNTETTAASKILAGYSPPINATAIDKLEAAGAIMVGKANLDAFAHGSSTENSDFGPTLNPVDRSRVPGGSSGGSAAAVALEIAPFALGTDTGGSIRLPASFCGVVGYKPTYGLVSRYGVVAMASSTDVIGPLTKSVEDAAVVLDILAGKDDKDATTIDVADKSFLDDEYDIKGKTFGLIKEHMGEGLSPEVRSVIESSVEKIKASGGIIKEVSLPTLDLALAAYYVIMPAEVSSNLSRYDGIRYGLSSEQAKSIDEVYDLSRSAGFNSEVKRRIIIGTYVLSSGYYEAHYKKAQSVRTKIVQDFERVFSSVDFLIGPTAPSPAFELGANTSDPLQMYLIDIMTVGVNLAGVPAISIPAGKSGELPVGLQIIAPQKADKKLLSVAAKINQKVSA